MESRLIVGAGWEELADELGRRLAAERGDPFVARIVALPGGGGGPLVRWLRDRLATVMGIVANVRFVGLEAALLERAGTAREPRSFVAGAADTVAVLAALPPHRVDPRFREVDAYLSEDRDRETMSLRSVLFAAEIAASLAQAERYRPSEEETLPAYQQALLAGVLAHRQARSLERRLVRREDDRGSSPPLHVFGLAGVSPVLLQALGRQDDGSVFVYALDGGPLETEPESPLLRTNGRTFHAANAAARGVGLTLERLPDRTSVHHAGSLHRIQRALRDDRPLTADDGLRPDATLQIHGAHGPRRQVEILHDVLLALFERDPTLRSSDVRIATPSVELYEPLVEAAFTGGDPGAGRAWPIRPSSHALASGEEHLAILEAVLALVDSRFDLAAVRDLLARPRVHARFGLDAEDVGVVGAWLEETRVSWGRDAPHRARCLGVDDDSHPLASLEEGTWTFGLTRLALAVTSFPESDLFHGCSAASDIEGSAARIVGGALAMIRALAAHVTILASPATISGWIDRAHEVLAAFVTGDGGDEDEAREDGGVEARRALHELAGQPGGSDLSLDARGFAALLTQLRSAPRRRAVARLGDLQLVPLSVETALPARVVAILGLDEDVFPRRESPPSVSVLARETRPLDPDARADDRAAFLQMLRAARDAFVVTARLRDARTNAARPLATPLAELLDALSAGTAEGAEDAWVTLHPLQPFGEPDLTDRGGAPPFSHDRRALAIAEALRQPAREKAGPFGGGGTPASTLPDYPELEISLEELIRLFRDPVRTLLSLRIGTTIEENADTPDRREPIELSALALWQLREQYFDVARDLPEPRLRELFRASGQLPLGGAGEAVLDDLGAELLALTTAFGEEVRAAHESPGQRASVELGDFAPPRRVEGTVRGRVGERLVWANLSRPDKPNQLLHAYLTLLVAGASGAGPGPGRADLLGLDDEGKAKRITLRAPPTEALCRATLSTYVAMFLEGMRRPLPFFEKTSFALARAFTEAGVSTGWTAALTGDPGDRARAAAWSAWSRQNGDREEIGERASRGAQAAFPGCPPFLDTSDRRRLDPGFVALAEAVYGPVLAAIELPETAPRGAAERAPSS